MLMRLLPSYRHAAVISPPLERGPISITNLELPKHLHPRIAPQYPKVKQDSQPPMIKAQWPQVPPLQVYRREDQSEKESAPGKSEIGQVDDPEEQRTDRRE